MPYKLWEAGSAIFNGISSERYGVAAEMPALVHEHGLKLTYSNSWEPIIVPDRDAITNILGGAETDRNLQSLSNHISHLRQMAAYATRMHFMHAIQEFVPASNRSVQSAIRNINPGIPHYLLFLCNFLGKDIKSPVRFLSSRSTTNDYGQDPSLTYSEEETGTYHTLQVLGDNQQWITYSGYLEDSPVSRRYIRYIDHLAQRFGMRLVYCPKGFDHLEEISEPTAPTIATQGGAVVRTVRADRYKLLFVSLAFDFSMFRDLTVIETEVQPNQPPRSAREMDYAPIFVDNLAGIVRVLTTLGAFNPCKIYYKDFRNSARSSQAVPPF